MPEYPEFPWAEGLANAMAHRDYSIEGEYTRVYIYDDRMEIQSPGKLPNIVTLENMRHTRYSRNPAIAWVFTAFDWVRELAVVAVDPIGISHTYSLRLGSGDISASTLHNVNGVFNQMMKSAVRDKLVASNPCDGVDAPRTKPKERRSFELEDALERALIATGKTTQAGWIHYVPEKIVEE